MASTITLGGKVYQAVSLDRAAQLCRAGFTVLWSEELRRHVALQSVVLTGRE